MVDPIAIGGGITALYLLLKKKKPVPALQEPDIQEIVQETPPEIIQVVVKKAVQTVSKERFDLVPVAPTPSAPSPQPGKLALLYKPDPSRCGFGFLVKRFPQLNFKYLGMGPHPSKLEIIVSTSDVNEALRLLDGYDCVTQARVVT